MVGGGYLVPGLGGEGGVPHLRSGWGGTPAQVWVVGYPIPGLDGGGVPGVPFWPSLDCGGIQGTPTKTGWGTWGTPPTTRTGWDTPHPGLDCGEVPSVPLTRTGLVPLGQVLMVGGSKHTPPPPPGLDGGGGGTWGTPPPPIRQSSIASTCYAAGGVPLALTQEDFLVFYLVIDQQESFFLCHLQQ